MIERLWWMGAVAAVIGCGSEAATLEIINDHDDVQAITALQIGGCTDAIVLPGGPIPAGELSEETAPSGDVRKVSIALGESYELELAPGCHSVGALRGGKVATARVRLEAGDSARWVPFRVDDIEEDDWKSCENTCDD